MVLAATARGQRRAKGINLLSIVKLLRSQRAAWQGVALSEAAAALLDQRIVATGWYSFVGFEELLVLAHQRLFGGSDAAAVQMGVAGGKLTFGGVHKAFVFPGEPARSMQAFARAWESYFDFGAASCEMGEGRATVRCTDYADMTRTHGFVIVGWALALLELCNVAEVEHAVTSAPWLGGRELCLELRWGT